MQARGDRSSIEHGARINSAELEKLMCDINGITADLEAALYG